LVTLYHIIICCYGLGIRIAALFQPKARKFIAGRKNIFAHINNRLKNESRQRVWLHCASLGEFEQARPLMELIRQNHPELCIILSFFSPSGYEVQRDYPFADYIFYLPLDTPAHARKFIALLKPSLALFVKYEFWYHYLRTLQKANIPVILFSALFQPRHPFFKWYGGLHRKMLKLYRHIFVQDEQSKILLAGIGIHHVSVAGDTRFDRAAEVLQQDKSYPAIETFKNGKMLLIAGSTWKEDELFLKKMLSINNPDFKLLIVPHEVHEAHINALRQMFNEQSCLWNDDQETLRHASVAIVHEIGHLSALFRYADAAWIGGGYTRSGIHNIIEPAVYGLPVFFGPNYKRYREAAQLIACGGALSLTDPEKLSTCLQNTIRFNNMGEQSRKYVLQHLGATQKIYDYLITEKCFFNAAIKF